MRLDYIGSALAFNRGAPYSCLGIFPTGVPLSRMCRSKHLIYRAQSRCELWIAFVGVSPTQESVLHPIAGSALLLQTGSVKGECQGWRMATSNHMDTFSNGVPRDEIIKPVWREKVRAAVCWGRGCDNNWAALEHRGGRMAATPPTSRARLLHSQWHRRQSSSLDRGNAFLPHNNPGTSPPGFSTTIAHSRMTVGRCHSFTFPE